TQAGRELIEVKSRYNQGRWELDFAALETALSQEKAKLLVLCNPWNPTGRVLSEAELRKVGQLALAHQVTVFADEIHAPLVLTDKARHIPFASLDPDFSQITVTAHAASKGWNLAGLHCAQMILPPSPLRDQFEDAGVTTQLAMGATPLGALAARAAYQEGGAWLQEIKSYIRENLARSRDLALQIAPRLNIPEVEGTYLSLWDASSYCDNPVKIAEEKARVGVNGGEILGSGYPGLLRLNAATPRYLFLEMTRRLASALREAEND
ncbi:MAG: aminotransferase class I/II-fold pyridoxal phosphate-dependent enzyme, partial [Varibaculum sp.]